MSKAKLKKELDQLDATQLRELISNIYDSSKEAKVYLEFFLEPDAEALLERKTKEVIKEIGRSKHGYSKTRSTVIRKAISELTAYKIGDSYVMRLMITTIENLVLTEKYFHFGTSQENCLSRLILDYLRLAFNAGEEKKALEFLRKLAEEREYSTPMMGRHLLTWTNQALAELNHPR